MQLKRFVAQDNHKALKLVRESLGAEAIIISSRKVDDGVEIIASDGLDDISTLQSTDVNSQKKMQKESQVANRSIVHEEKQQADTTEFAAVLDDVSNAVEISDMRAEINKLRNVLDAEISAIKVGHWGQQSKARAELFEKLSRIGLGVDLITKLVSCTEANDDMETASRKVLVKLKESIKIKEYDVSSLSGVVVLHGPTGAGKTTTVAKLAAHFLQKNDARDLVLVCADNARVGAQAQLETFGKLLGVSVVRVRETGEINSLLSLLREKKLVLLDTAGFGQVELRQPEKLFGMKKSIENVHHYLAIAATMQRSAMERILDSFSKLKLEGVILTKLDDAVHLGDVLTSIVRHDVPLAYWTDGQNIASDLHRADAAILISKAMHLNKTTSESKDDQILLSMLQNSRQLSEIWH